MLEYILLSPSCLSVSQTEGRFRCLHKIWKTNVSISKLRLLLIMAYSSISLPLDNLFHSILSSFRFTFFSPSLSSQDFTNLPLTPFFPLPLIFALQSISVTPSFLLSLSSHIPLFYYSRLTDFFLSFWLYLFYLFLPSWSLCLQSRRLLRYNRFMSPRECSSSQPITAQCSHWPRLSMSRRKFSTATSWAEPELMV